MFTKPEADPKTVASILGGGAGTRLFPLTGRRAKPDVPIGGCYRLIDVPMSNCINNGINKIYILTQFNSQSLNRHIARTYNLGNGVNFGDRFVEAKLSANGDEAWKDREAAVLALGAIAEGCISVLYPHLSEVTCGVRGKLDPPCNAVGYKDREVLGINHMYYHPAWRRSKDMEISTSLITTVLPLCF